VLTLALRSIVDVNAVQKVEEQISKNDGLNVIRYGVALQQSMQK
jgi:pilus assembly protein CpaB